MEKTFVKNRAHQNFTLGICQCLGDRGQGAGTLSKIGERPRIHSYFHDIRVAKEATIRHGPVRGDDSGSSEIGHYIAATKDAADRPQLRLSRLRA